MIEIAKILKPQGIKGEVKALPLTNVLAVFNSLESCLIGNQIMHIKHISVRQGYVYITFDEIRDRNEAEKYRNKDIKVAKELLESCKKEDEFFVADLIGMLLYDQNNVLVGQIIGVQNYGACDIFEIEIGGHIYQAPYVESVFKAKDGGLVVDSEKLKEVLI